MKDTTLVPSVQEAMDEAYVWTRQRVRDSLEWGDPIPDEALMGRIEQTLFSSPLAGQFTSEALDQIVKRVYYSFRGLDALQPLVDDPDITEIMINSHEECFIERKGRVERLEIGFENEGKLEDVIQAVVSQVNRVVNEASPIVDARLPDGSRVHVVLPPIALKGPTVTIRKFPAEPMKMGDLIRWGALSEQAALLLQTLVAAKFNIFISGGTGSGKTTFLNALSQYIPSQERVITIEDAAELQIRTVPNLVSLETRNANTEGKGAVTIRDLIRASLRMRPDRIVVGEVRGAEALDMLQAMNTGHDGSPMNTKCTRKLIVFNGDISFKKFVFHALNIFALCGEDDLFEDCSKQILFFYVISQCPSFFEFR
ncbi:CpaF family protein [Paenibacillus dendritiformis]|uniref:CpaF family protein n=1 Tax=Paenibacillus dendritiformis TaxID=130049 RepID=UPI001FCFAA4F|nr:ATPase, T2SS/T4P/T4SS family [Paenibacillus dendritiformis]